MMGKWIAAVGLITVLALALAGCKKPAPGQSTFDQINAGGFAIGISFDMDPNAVHAKLGPPSSSNERQGGATVVDSYLAPEATSADRDTPQLELTFAAGKLIRLYNRYHPEDPTMVLPPFFIEPLPGVKLGARNVEMSGVLGVPAHTSGTAQEWRISNRDGNMISILAQYTDMPNTEDKLCSSLTVIYGKAQDEDRGESQNQTDWRDLAKDMKEGGGK
jgi:hypothetical protein